jgi:hypothetical protein
METDPIAPGEVRVMNVTDYQLLGCVTALADKLTAQLHACEGGRPGRVPARPNIDEKTLVFHGNLQTLQESPYQWADQPAIFTLNGAAIAGTLKTYWVTVSVRGRTMRGKIQAVTQDGRRRWRFMAEEAVDQQKLVEHLLAPA